MGRFPAVCVYAHFDPDSDLAFVGEEVLNDAILETEGIGCPEWVHNPGEGSGLVPRTGPQSLAAAIVLEPPLIHYLVDSDLLGHLLLIKDQCKEQCPRMAEDPQIAYQTCGRGKLKIVQQVPCKNYVEASIRRQLQDIGPVRFHGCRIFRIFRHRRQGKVGTQVGYKDGRTILRPEFDVVSANRSEFQDVDGDRSLKGLTECAEFAAEKEWIEVGHRNFPSKSHCYDINAA